MFPFAWRIASLTVVMFILSANSGFCIAVEGADIVSTANDSVPKNSKTPQEYLALIDKVAVVNVDSAFSLVREAQKFFANHGDSKLQMDLNLRLITLLCTKGQHDLAFEKAQDLLDVSHGNENKRIRGVCLSLLSRISEMKGDFRSGIRYGREALHMLSELSDSIAMMGAATNLGNNYMYAEKYDSAYSYYSYCDRIAQLVGDKRQLAISHTSMAIISGQLGNYEEAWRHCRDGSVISREIGQWGGLSTDLYNMAYYANFIPAFADSIPVYLDSSIHYAALVGNNSIMITALNLLGAYYNGTGKSEKALTMHRRALELTRSFQNKVDEARLLASVGHDFKNLGNEDSAIFYINKGMDIAQQLGNQKLIADIHESYVVTYTKFEKYEKALQHALIIQSIKDSLNRQEQNERLLELRAAYDTERKEREIAVLSLQAERRRLFVIGLGLLSLLLGVLFLFYRSENMRVKEETRSLLLEIDALKNSMAEQGMRETLALQPLDIDENGLNAMVEEGFSSREIEVIKAWLNDHTLTNEQYAQQMTNITVDGLKSANKRIFAKLRVNGKNAKLLAIQKIMRHTGVHNR